MEQINVTSLSKNSRVLLWAVGGGIIGGYLGMILNNASNPILYSFIGAICFVFLLKMLEYWSGEL